MDKTNIVVIGAGVTGLTTALLLKQKGYKHVTIVAKYIPGDMNIEYTSPYAGAHWRTMAPNNNKLLCKLDAVTYEKFMQFARNTNKSQGTRLKNEEMGIMVLTSFDYYDDDSAPEVRDPWFKDTVYNFKKLTEKDGRLPKGAKVGHLYSTVLINSPVYLKWLENQFKKLGGEIIQQSLSHIDEIFDFFPPKSKASAVVINCTGLGAKFLGGVNDDALFPTRGQVVVVKAPHIKRTMTHIGTEGMTYIIPRSDGTVILGGTAIKNDFNPYAEETTVQSIIRRTTALCPELIQDGKPLDIVRHAVGLRPTRIGGPRFENETRVSKKHDFPIHVTHAYGHGGFGYQSSWGSAQYTIEIMEKRLKAGAHLNNKARL